MRYHPLIADRRQIAGGRVCTPKELRTSMASVFASLPRIQHRRTRLIQRELASVRHERMTLELSPPACAEALLQRCQRADALWQREQQLRARLEALKARQYRL